MNHPILVAALAEHRRRRCRCGAVAPALWPVPRVPGIRRLAPRDRTGEASRRSQLDACRNPEARLLARVPSLVQMISKGAES